MKAAKASPEQQKKAIVEGLCHLDSLAPCARAVDSKARVATSKVAPIRSSLSHVAGDVRIRSRSITVSGSFFASMLFVRQASRMMKARKPPGPLCVPGQGRRLESGSDECRESRLFEVAGSNGWYILQKENPSPVVSVTDQSADQRPYDSGNCKDARDQTKTDRSAIGSLRNGC